MRHQPRSFASRSGSEVALGVGARRRLAYSTVGA
jgi:hypothetical protein